MKRWLVGSLLAAMFLVGCAGAKAAKVAKPKPLGTPSSAEYVAVQAADVPQGLQRCEYSGPIGDYAAAVSRLKPGSTSVADTWKQLQDAGATDGYVAVYADTPDACTTWIVGSPEGHATSSAIVISTVAARFADQAAAEAAYRADIFKQSQLTPATGLRVLSGMATGLSPNAAIGADEKANPTQHQAVWQQGPFNIFFNGRNLTRAEFEAATISENSRAQ